MSFSDKKNTHGVTVPSQARGLGGYLGGWPGELLGAWDPRDSRRIFFFFRSVREFSRFDGK